MIDSHHQGHYTVPYLLNASSATALPGAVLSLKRDMRHSREGRGSAEITNFSLHYNVVRLSSLLSFTSTLLFNFTPMKAEQLIGPSSPVCSFQFPWSRPVLMLSLMPCLRILYLALLGCYEFTILYYTKIPSSFFHLYHMKLLLISTVAPLLLFDLLNSPKKTATYPPSLLLSWHHVSSVPAFSHRNHSVTCFFHPHMFKISILSCKALPKGVTCIFLYAGLVAHSWTGNCMRFKAYPPAPSPVCSIYQSRNTKKRCVANRKRF